jgi:Glycosyl hydrolase family 12
MKPKEASMFHLSTRLSAFVRPLILALLLAIIAAFALGPHAPAHAAVWSSSAQFGSWSNGGYTLNNDVWGSGAGPQTIWANSYSNWGVWSNQPNTGGVKSYPHSGLSIGRQLSALHSTTSSFNVSVPGSGSYETAYDIWCNGSSYEIMLWMNKTGAVGPLGSYQTTTSVGGHTWNVYSGSNGSNAVFSFVRTSNTSSGSVDIRAVLNWIKSKGWFGNVTLSQVQFGFEITSSSGGLNFVSNSFSVSYS